MQQNISDPQVHYQALLSLLKRITFTCECLTQQAKYIHEQVKIIKSKLPTIKISSWTNIHYKKVSNKLRHLNSKFLSPDHRNGAKALFQRKISHLTSECPQAVRYFSGF